MAINGESISNMELVTITERVKQIADEMIEKPTEFELVTAIALEYFKQNKCDYVVLECGLGGRLDSTNVVNTTVLSVITGISLDHVSILGDTIEKIAYEKAGIIKQSTPCLWCGESKEAKAIIEKKACEKSAVLYEVNHKSIKINEATLNGTFFDFEDYKNIKINLLGTYQPINASNVLKAIEILKSQGALIEEEHIRRGLEKSRWSARFERILDTPPMIFDGGHNAEGVFSAVESIEKYFPDERVYIITGVMRDKDYNAIAKRVSTVAEKVFTVTPNNPRALSAKKYASVYTDMGTDAQDFDCILNAVKACVREAREKNKAIVCLGSLYMYSELVDCLEKIF
jgi:dihydrofolate synthase/folylpolyglutamate synthase